MTTVALALLAAWPLAALVCALVIGRVIRIADRMEQHRCTADVAFVRSPADLHDLARRIDREQQP